MRAASFLWPFLRKQILIIVFVSANWKRWKMFAFRDVVSTFIQTHTHKTTECTLHTMGNATISFRPFSFSPARKDTASNRLNQTMVLDYGRRRCGAIMVWCCMRFNRNFAALTQRILNWVFFAIFIFFCFLRPDQTDLHIHCVCNNNCLAAQNFVHTRHTCHLFARKTCKCTNAMAKGAKTRNRVYYIRSSIFKCDGIFVRLRAKCAVCRAVNLVTFSKLKYLQFVYTIFFALCFFPTFALRLSRNAINFCLNTVKFPTMNSLIDPHTASTARN